MDAKQFAWVYLIENGHAASEHSFYGGYTVVDQRMKHIERSDDFWKNGPQQLRDAYLQEIRTHGVNWNKTMSPESDMVSKFTDTFHEPDRKEVLTGELVLNNGLRQTWTADAVEVTNVFEMMAQVHSGALRYAELFGSE